VNLIAAYGGNNTSGPLDVATARNGHAGPHGRLDFESETFVAHALRADGFDASEDGTGRGTPLVPIAFDTTQITSRENRVQPKDVCHPLAAGAHAPATAYRLYTANADVREAAARIDVSATLNSTCDHIGNTGTQVVADPICANEARTYSNAGNNCRPRNVVAFDARGREGGSQMEGPHETANVRAASGGSSRSYVLSFAVRRLTPTEAERLQGFPDGHTAIRFKGKPAADGPRYKALGNAMAVNCMRWIGRRIEACEAAA
jgi:DNA (cytosine-5)-methyltransferase 1